MPECGWLILGTTGAGLVPPPGSREFRGLGGRLPLAYAVGNRGPLPSDDSDLGAATAMMNGGCMGCHGGCAVLLFFFLSRSVLKRVLGLFFLLMMMSSINLRNFHDEDC